MRYTVGAMSRGTYLLLLNLAGEMLCRVLLLRISVAHQLPITDASGGQHRRAAVLGFNVIWYLGGHTLQINRENAIYHYR